MCALCLRYDPVRDVHIPVDAFYNVLAHLVCVKPKLVYLRAAEVCGLALKQAREAPAAQRSAADAASQLPPKLQKYVDKMIATNRYKQVLACVGQVAKHDPSFVSRHLLLRVMSRLGHAHERHAALQIIMTRATELPDMFSSLQPYVPAVLLDRSPATQQLMLEILFKLLKNLTREHIMTFLSPDVAHSILNIFPSHANAECRNAFYKVVVWLWDNHAAFAGGADEDAEVDDVATIPSSGAYSYGTTQESKGAEAGTPGRNGTGDADGEAAAARRGRALLRRALLHGLKDPLPSIRTGL